MSSSKNTLFPRKPLPAAVLLVSVVLFFLQDRYAIPNIDDWAYTLVAAPGDSSGYLSVTPDREPVASLSDAISSQQNEYLKTNGRFVVHVLVQYFCATLSRQQFTWLNTAAFAFFIILAVRLASRKTDVWLLLTFVSGLWLLLPYQGFVLMGPISLCVNYLWTSVATLLLLLLFRRIAHHNTGRLLLVATVLYAFVAGSLQESFSIGVGTALLLLVAVRWQRVNRQAALLPLAYLAGAATCILAPGNFQRTEAMGETGAHLNAVFGLLSSATFILLLALTVIQAVRHRLRHFFYQHFVLLTASLIALLFAVFVAYTARHQLMVVNIFSFIIVFSCWSGFVAERKKLKRTVAIVLTVAAAFLYSSVLSVRSNWHEAYTSFEQRSRTSTDGTVDGGTFEAMADELMYHRLLNNYATIFTFVGWDFGKQMFSMYLTKGKSNTQVVNVLPVPKEQLARQSLEAGVPLCRLTNGYYVWRTDRCLPKDSVLLAGRRESGFVFHSASEGRFKADETFCHNGHYYYLFNNKPAIVRVDSICR